MERINQKVVWNWSNTSWVTKLEELTNVCAWNFKNMLWSGENVNKREGFNFCWVAVVVVIHPFYEKGRRGNKQFYRMTITEWIVSIVYLNGKSSQVKSGSLFFREASLCNFDAFRPCSFSLKYLKWFLRELFYHLDKTICQ